MSAAAGPFTVVSAGCPVRAGCACRAGSIVGRSAQAGPVDRLTLDSGHWLTGPGQIVLSRDYAGPLTERSVRR